MTPPKGDPEQEKVGTEGAAPEAEGDAATEAKEAAAKEEPKAGRARTTKTQAEGKEDAQEKPKPRRSRAKKADEAEGEQPRAEEAAAEEGDEPAEDEEKPKRRRGAAETTAAKPKPAPRRQADGQVIVRAKAKYVRTAPRKARLVIDHIRGKSVDDARAILQHTPRAASQDVLKLLNSAVANAENNHELVADELKVHQAYVDEGPTLKRFRPRAMGRATRIRKRTSHMTITLTPKE